MLVANTGDDEERQQEEERQPVEQGSDDSR